MIELPEHKASLSLVHNEHKDYYMTAEECINQEEHGYRNWVSEEQKLKAIETNNCWYIQVYPNTPVGFYTYASADLDVLLEFINKGE